MKIYTLASSCLHFRGFNVLHNTTYDDINLYGDHLFSPDINGFIYLAIVTYYLALAPRSITYKHLRCLRGVTFKDKVLLQRYLISKNDCPTATRTKDTVSYVAELTRAAGTITQTRVVFRARFCHVGKHTVL